MNGYCNKKGITPLFAQLLHLCKSECLTFQYRPDTEYTPHQLKNPKATALYPDAYESVFAVS